MKLSFIFLIFAFLNLTNKLNGDGYEYAIFGESKTNIASVKSWIEADNTGILAWEPPNLGADKSYLKLVESIRSIAMHGDYFNASLIAKEIRNELNVGNYSSLLGWTQALNGTSQANDMLEITLKLLSEDFDEITYSAVGICFITLFKDETRKKSTTMGDVNEIDNKFKKVRSIVSLGAFSKKTLQQEFNETVIKFRADRK